MKSVCAFSLFVICSLALLAVPTLSADFFYIVQQWPGSSCVASNGCCFPANKKPARDFTIDVLRPAFNNGSDPPHFCNSNTVFPISETSDLTKSLGVSWPLLTCPWRDERTLWAEWREYGTCSGLGVNQYFSRAIAYKKQANILCALAAAGLKPDGKLYNTGDISEAIRVKVGKMPGLWCNKDKSGKSQLFQVVLCGQGNKIIDCIGIPQKDRCSGSIKFPSF